MSDLISRQEILESIERISVKGNVLDDDWIYRFIQEFPSAQPEPRYTEEELRVFQHGISLSLLSKRSAQHWHYDEDTATEIEFLERLYDKVGADMKGGQG